MSSISEIINDIELTDSQKIARAFSILAGKDACQEDFSQLADALVDSFSVGNQKLASPKYYAGLESFIAFESLLESTSWVNKDYYKAFHAVVHDKKQEVFIELQRFLERCCEKKEPRFSYSDFFYTFVVPFKNAFVGFWTWLADQLSEYHLSSDGLSELCQCLEAFYHSQSEDDVIDLLLSLLSQHPEFTVIKEMLGHIYYTKRMWKNAISYYEMVFLDSSAGTTFFLDALAFQLGWLYSSTQNHTKAIEYYREALKIHPEISYAKNNMGYCYYSLKQYETALKLFEECIQEGIDSPYCYNNKVRTLIQMGRHDEAVSFARENLQRGKVSKNMLQLAESAITRSAVSSLQQSIGTAEQMPKRAKVLDGLEKLRFSSERILEDEIILRLERHDTVFGHRLKVYDQPGDYYGRQYPIQGGRIDILTVDSDDNFHVIELKKDDGYGDVLQQMRHYIDWIRTHKVKPGKKAFGIICLNNPSASLKKKLKAENDIRLFEYSIVYNEIR